MQTSTTSYMGANGTTSQVSQINRISVPDQSDWCPRSIGLVSQINRIGVPDRSDWCPTSTGLGVPHHRNMHFTPTSSSWLNLIERWFAAITQDQIRRGTHRSTKELETAIKKYLDVYNENPKPFIWTKSADQILESVKIYCTRINNTLH